MGKYVGIDLGTTFSVVSYIDDRGNPVLIDAGNGKYTMPSVVFFGDEAGPIVGATAKKKGHKNPQNYEAFVKRHMAERNYLFTTQAGNSYTPEEISALILRKLKQNAEERLGEEIEGAVITVPAYFGDGQRQATKDAAKLAGIKVLDIINEPTAAAIAFGASKNIDTKQHVLIYDFGGGTFDVSLLEIDSSNITVLASNGDHTLGGYDIDKTIVDYVIEEGKKQGLNVATDKVAMQKLWIAAEEAKIELSNSSSADIELTVKGEDLNIELNREDFEERIEGILDTTLSVMQGTLDEVNMDYDDISKILLVGGSTRIPCIRGMIEEETGIVPSFEVHPDEAVSIGAAFHAVNVAKKVAEGEMKTEEFNAGNVNSEDIPELENTYSFIDVTSHSIGIVVWDSVLEKDINSIILEKNTKIPAEVTNNDYSTTEPFQSGFKLRITQGESKTLDYVTIIGEAEIQVRPRENIVPIGFTVSCDEGGIVHIRAMDLDDNINLGELTINREKHNMTQEQMQTASIRMNKLDIG